MTGTQIRRINSKAEERAGRILRIMVNQAKRRIVVADRSKLSAVSTYRFCGAGEIHALITDAGATDEAIQPFQALGIEVRRV